MIYLKQNIASSIEPAALFLGGCLALHGLYKQYNRRSLTGFVEIILGVGVLIIMGASFSLATKKIENLSLNENNANKTDSENEENVDNTPENPNSSEIEIDFSAWDLDDDSEDNSCESGFYSGGSGGGGGGGGGGGISVKYRTIIKGNVAYLG